MLPFQIKPMRRFFIALLFIQVFSFAAQGQTSVVKGKINFNSDYFINVSRLSLDPNRSEANQEVNIADDGSFLWANEEQSEPAWYQVMVMPKARNKQLGATFPLRLRPNAKEELQLSYSDTSYIQSLSKKTSAENSVLINYAGFVNQRIREGFLNPPKGDQLDGFLNAYLTKATELGEASKVKNPDVKEYLKVWSYNSYLSALFSLDRRGEMTNLPTDLFATLDTDRLFMFYNGVSNLNQLIDLNLKKQGVTKQGEGYLAQKLAFIKRSFKNGKLIDGLITADLSQYVTSYKLSSKEQFSKDIIVLEQHLQQLSDKQVAKQILQDFTNLRYTALGSDIPEIQFKNERGELVSLQSFKGKYIYIDLWASWCVPCIKEIPFLKELEASFSSKNIAFVSISLDEDKAAWRKKIKDLDLHGEQWELGDSSFDKLMNIRGIPHFILYGPDGKLIHYQAPRPSSPEIKEIFNKI